MNRFVLRFLSCAILLLSLSCKGSESNYVTVVFKYFNDGGSGTALKQLSVIVLRGNPVNSDTVNALMKKEFLVSGYAVSKLVEVTDSFSEESEYSGPNSTIDDSKIKHSIRAADFGFYPFPEDTVVYVVYEPNRT